MGRTTIEWTDFSFNPWIGCTKVSPACDNCYAEAFAKRCGGPRWGNREPRRRTSPRNWSGPLRWNREAAAAGTRYRVFCASLADVFDTEVPDEWRDDLFELVGRTPGLDWLLLTKRPKAARDYLSARHAYSKPLPNVWLGATVENQKMADLRVPPLLDAPAAKRFLSMEPLLGPVDLSRFTMRAGDGGSYGYWPMLRAVDPWMEGQSVEDLGDPSNPGIDWVIVGGESGGGARPMHPDWARDIRDQCRKAGVPYLFKQWGEWTPGENVSRAHGTARTASWFDGGWVFDSENLARLDGHADDAPDLYRIGKKAAGRTLDGETHDAFPGPT